MGPIEKLMYGIFHSFTLVYTELSVVYQWFYSWMTNLKVEEE